MCVRARARVGWAGVGSAPPTPRTPSPPHQTACLAAVVGTQAVQQLDAHVGGAKHLGVWLAPLPHRRRHRAQPALWRARVRLRLASQHCQRGGQRMLVAQTEALALLLHIKSYVAVPPEDRIHRHLIHPQLHPRGTRSVWGSGGRSACTSARRGCPPRRACACARVSANHWLLLRQWRPTSNVVPMAAAAR